MIVPRKMMMIQEHDTLISIRIIERDMFLLRFVFSHPYLI